MISKTLLGLALLGTAGYVVITGGTGAQKKVQPFVSGSGGGFHFLHLPTQAQAWGLRTPTGEFSTAPTTSLLGGTTKKTATTTAGGTPLIEVGGGTPLIEAGKGVVTADIIATGTKKVYSTAAEAAAASSTGTSFVKTKSGGYIPVEPIRLTTPIKKESAGEAIARDILIRKRVSPISSIINIFRSWF